MAKRARKMYIVQVSSYYPPHLGGQENAVASLASQLARAGYRVDVLTSVVGGGPGGVSVEQGVRVNRLRAVVFGHAPIMPWFPIALFRAARSNAVVHIHIGQAFTPEMVWLVSRLRHFKYVAHLHIDFEPSGPAGFLLPMYKRYVLKPVLRAAGCVVVLNEKTLQTVRTAYGVTGKAQIMNNGIDEIFFAIKRKPLPPTPPRTLRLVFVGRLSKQKNVLALLSALQLTKKSVHLDIIGEGPEGEAIQRRIGGIDPGLVTLHGRLTREEVIDFYRNCDAAIMPSLYEAQPLVLLEAMAARIPIIGTSVIGVEDHLAGVGIIVAPTPVGIADGIAQFYSQYASLPAMVEEGYRRANNLRWSKTLHQYEALYETVLGT
jgi:glycosyltransferase involved in cell wall biosynthesis